MDGLYIVIPSNSQIVLDQYETEWLFAKCDNIQYRVFGSTQYFENHNVVELLNNKNYGHSKVNTSPYDIFIGINK